MHGNSLVTSRGVRALTTPTVALLGALLTASIPAPVMRAQATSAAPVFRSGVDVVPVAAVVRDRRGQVVRDLVVEDFEVFDNGERRRIVSFARGDDGPISLALLVDVSGSMKVDVHRASARRVVDQLLASLRTNDEVALLTFDKGLSVEQDFTSDWARIREALDEVEPFGSTSLYDAIAETAGQLERERTGRRAIVVVTDGLDNASRMQPADVSGIASRSDVPVYVLAVVSALDVPGTNAGTVGSQATGQLKNLAWWTGGDAFVVSSPAQMSVASRAVLSELRHQYVLAIESAGDAGWRPLDIKTRRRELQVRARSGYFAMPRRLG
jgi:Ca-activated chloride channel family protein